jgi:hypothetical protein
VYGGLQLEQVYSPPASSKTSGFPVIFMDSMFVFHVPSNPVPASAATGSSSVANRDLALHLAVNDWRQFLFSLQGRLGRKQFWLFSLVSIPFGVAASMINDGDTESPFHIPGLFILLPLFWPGFAVTVKRWHDRNKSGWWILVNIIPIVGYIWSRARVP